jgi:hypothetical protein
MRGILGNFSFESLLANADARVREYPMRNSVDLWQGALMAEYCTCRLGCPKSGGCQLTALEGGAINAYLCVDYFKLTAFSSRNGFYFIPTIS